MYRRRYNVVGDQLRHWFKIHTQIPASRVKGTNTTDKMVNNAIFIFWLILSSLWAIIRSLNSFKRLSTVELNLSFEDACACSTDSAHIISYLTLLMEQCTAWPVEGVGSRERHGLSRQRFFRLLHTAKRPHWYLIHMLISHYIFFHDGWCDGRVLSPHKGGVPTIIDPSWESLTALSFSPIILSSNQKAHHQTFTIW